MAMKDNSIKNVIVALFDFQFDHISQHPSEKELTKRRPATALLSIKDLPIISKYILVTPKEHLEAARRLVPLLEDRIRDIIHTRIKDINTANALISGIEELVQICEIEYGNIWDITSCTEKLKPILEDLLKGFSIRKEPKTGKVSKSSLIISLLGST